MPTIWDIDELRPLEAIGQRHGLAFTLRGGAAFRLALRLNSAGELDDSPISLFELAPFTADINLVRSGPPETTGELLDAILSDVAIEPVEHRVSGVFYCGLPMSG